MGNLGDTKPINKLTIEIDGDIYEFSSGGGTPGPNTVGTDQIIDGAVEEQDLNDHVKDRMTVTHDSSSGGLRIGGYAKPGEIPSDSEPVGQGGGEDTGFDAGADDGNDDI